jgi:membrane protein DedA with SNARE-associated domain
MAPHSLSDEEIKQRANNQWLADHFGWIISISCLGLLAYAFNQFVNVDLALMLLFVLIILALIGSTIYGITWTISKAWHDGQQ